MNKAHDPTLGASSFADGASTPGPTPLPRGPAFVRRSAVLLAAGIAVGTAACGSGTAVPPQTPPQRQEEMNPTPPEPAPQVDPGKDTGSEPPQAAPPPQVAPQNNPSPPPPQPGPPPPR